MLVERHASWYHSHVAAISAPTRWHLQALANALARPDAPPLIIEDTCFLVMDEGEKAGREKGKKEGCEEGLRVGAANAAAEALLRVLAARGLAVTEAERPRVLTCGDLATLEGEDHARRDAPQHREGAARASRGGDHTAALQALPPPVTRRLAPLALLAACASRLPSPTPPPSTLPPPPGVSATPAEAGTGAARTERDAGLTSDAAAEDQPAVDASVTGGTGGVGCSALLAASFHLRPRAVRASVGPEYPAGTHVSVLALTGLRRTWSNGEATSALARVRVDADGAEGFAFVRPSEFTATCPILTVDRGEGPVASVPTALPVHRTRAAALRRFTRPTIQRRFDADGDGAPDELLSALDEGGGTLLDRSLLVHRAADGFTVSFLEETPNRDCGQAGITHLTSVVGTAPIPTVVFLAFDCSGEPGTYDVFRWVGVGGMRRVFSQVFEVGGEELVWSADPDGALRATGRVSRRSQRLLWDDRRQRLVAEGGSFCVRFSDDVDCAAR